MKLTTFHYFIIFIILIGALIVGARMWGESQPGALDQFAQCLAKEEATFYGAFWCPHCEDQKKVFGNSADLLPYVECSTPDGQNQTQVCSDAEVTSYPTWELADGTRLPGVQQPQQLADATGCPLPEGY